MSHKKWQLMPKKFLGDQGTKEAQLRLDFRIPTYWSRLPKHQEVWLRDFFYRTDQAINSLNEMLHGEPFGSAEVTMVDQNPMGVVPEQQFVMASPEQLAQMKAQHPEWVIRPANRSELIALQAQE